MPVTHRIDTDLALVVSTWVGPVTLEDALGHNAALRSDPDFRSDMRQLSDARFATSHVSAAGVRGLAKQTPFGPGSRRAILVADDAIFGVSRMYEAQLEGSGAIQVFRDVHQALAWLDLPPDLDALVDSGAPEGGQTLGEPAT